MELLGWGYGLGIALVFFAGVGLMIDGFTDRHARAYGEVVNEMKSANLQNAMQRAREKQIRRARTLFLTTNLGYSYCA